MPETHWSLVEGESIELAHLKVSIKGIKPPIFRELIVPMDMSFQELHTLIQAAFGWENAHLYQFNYLNEIICEENTAIDQDYVPAELERLSDVGISKGDIIIYEYDFGEWLQVDNLRLMSIIGCHSKNTFLKSRDELIQNQFIIHKCNKRGLNRKSPVCWMLKFLEILIDDGQRTVRYKN